MCSLTQNGLSRRAYWAGEEPIANVLMAQTLANPDLISLAAGFVDHETLPAEADATGVRHDLVRPGTCPGGTAIRHDDRLSAAARGCRSSGCSRPTGARPPS